MAQPNVHPSAIIDPTAHLDDDVEVGPYAVIGRDTRIGAGSRIMHAAHVAARVTMGPRNTIHPYAVIGGPPQDKGWKGEVNETLLGADNWIREGATIHFATGEGKKTVIGDRNMFMNQSHVAHNCVIGNDCIFGGYAGAAGHCVIEDRVLLGPHSGPHQFVRIGTMTMFGGYAASSQDVPPYMTLVGVRPFGIVGLNTIGLRRNGVSREGRVALKRAFHVLYGGARRAMAEVLPELEAIETPEVQRLVKFIRESKRGVVRRRHSERGGAGDAEE